MDDEWMKNGWWIYEVGWGMDEEWMRYGLGMDEGLMRNEWGMYEERIRNGWGKDEGWMKDGWGMDEKVWGMDRWMDKINIDEYVS